MLIPIPTTLIVKIELLYHATFCISKNNLMHNTLFTVFTICITQKSECIQYVIYFYEVSSKTIILQYDDRQ